MCNETGGQFFCHLSHYKYLSIGEREIVPTRLLSGLDEVCYTKLKAGEMSEDAPTVMWDARQALKRFVGG